MRLLPFWSQRCCLLPSSSPRHTPAAAMCDWRNHFLFGCHRHPRAFTVCSELMQPTHSRSKRCKPIVAVGEVLEIRHEKGCWPQGWCREKAMLPPDRSRDPPVLDTHRRQRPKIRRTQKGCTFADLIRDVVARLVIKAKESVEHVLRQLALIKPARERYGAQRDHGADAAADESWACMTAA